MQPHGAAKNVITACFSRRRMRFCLPLIFLTTGLLGLAPAETFDAEVRPLLETYCFKCHGAEKQKAGVKLHEAHDLRALYSEVGTWDKVLVELRDEAMPPDDKPQPSAAERQRLIAWLEKTLNDPDLAAVPRDPGRPVLHRLSRIEYNNTVRDLLGVDSHPADSFPPDGGGGGGFDNNSATLFIPPVLMEKYLSTASTLLARAPRSIASSPPARAPRCRARTLREKASRTSRRAPFDGRSSRRKSSRCSRSSRRPKRAARPLTRPSALPCAACSISPNFLFRVETPRGAEPHPLDDFELASRLSYFLWSSMPDEELFAAARAGKLHDPATLEAQTRRMLLDPQGARICGELRRASGCACTS